MKSFKYTINGNVYKVHINSIVDDVADVEVVLEAEKGKTGEEANDYVEASGSSTTYSFGRSCRFTSGYT